MTEHRNDQPGERGYGDRPFPSRSADDLLEFLRQSRGQPTIFVRVDAHRGGENAKDQFMGAPDEVNRGRALQNLPVEIRRLITDPVVVDPQALLRREASSRIIAEQALLEHEQRTAALAEALLTRELDHREEISNLFQDFEGQINGIMEQHRQSREAQRQYLARVRESCSNEVLKARALTTKSLATLAEKAAALANKIRRGRGTLSRAKLAMEIHDLGSPLTTEAEPQ